MPLHKMLFTIALKKNINYPNDLKIFAKTREKVCRVFQDSDKRDLHEICLYLPLISTVTAHQVEMNIEY